ncbi:hypothetical protein M2368_002394 [Arthrobacter sp. JUb119]|nr:hypothetical protein [Arthrobacter sp. JUb119]
MLDLPNPLKNGSIIACQNSTDRLLNQIHFTPNWFNQESRLRSVTHRRLFQCVVLKHVITFFQSESSTGEQSG